jgi:endonuclease/exonuclease/phosphatase family metal-dependent hydrolase
MTYNIHHGANMDRVYALEGIAEAIREQRPDLVALQEVDRRWSARSSFDDQPARLSEMTGLEAHFGVAQERDGGEYGNLILSRYPLTERSVAPLPRLSEAAEPRCVVSARVEVQGAALRFWCTHLQHNSAEERAAQVRALLGHLHNEPTVLAGDLNAQPRDAELAPLMHELTDAWAACSAEPGYTIPSTGPTKRIDYVFTSSGLRVAGARIPTTRASDHLPVVVDLELSARALSTGRGHAVAR